MSIVLIDPNNPLLAQKVRIRRGLEGPQLILEWDRPLDTPLGATIKVLRLLYEFPDNPFIGDVVFEGPADNGFVADLALEPCKCYYYTIFTHTVLDDTWRYSPATQAAELAIETGFFANRLFELLPNLYILGDKILDGTITAKDDSVYPLFPVFDATDHEWFNIHENTNPDVEPKKRGPLNRFLKDIALEPDIVKGLADCFPTIFDVDETCCGNLQALAGIVALDINKEFSCGRQRDEIKEQVAILKVKGTKTAIKARGTLITGLETEIQEWCGNILITNRLDRTSLRFPNPGFSEKYRLFGDDTSYTPGNGIGFTRFSIFFKLLCDSCVSETEVDKINRVMPSEFPVCHIGDFNFVDCIFEEIYDRTRMDDPNYDEIYDSVEANTERVDRKCWLISNRLSDVTFPETYGPAPDLGCQHNLSNSLCATSAINRPICHEAWWDEYITPARINLANMNVSRINDDEGWIPPPCDIGRVDIGRADCARVDEG